MFQDLLTAARSNPVSDPAIQLILLAIVIVLSRIVIARPRASLRARLGVEPRPGDRITWFMKFFGASLMWPAVAAASMAVVVVLLPGDDPLRDRLRVTAVLWFLVYYLLAESLLFAFVQAGPRRRQLRLVFVPIGLTLAVLDRLRLLDPVVNWLDRPLLTLMDAQISMLSLLTALLIVVAFVFGAKAVGDIIANRIMPRLGIEAALSDALGAISRYLITVLGVLMASDHLGLDLTGLKIVLGALSVGIGFGLQNVVNNFVSGLILMFERTIKRGDIIQLDGTAGRVLSIGLRSSVVRTRAGHEIIVPNGDLIASRVDNLSYRDPLMRLDVPIGVSYGSDPEAIRAILLGVAAAHAATLEAPPASVLFTGYGESSLDFQLRVWISDAWRTPTITSELLYAAWYALKDAGVEIPFPQRDLHIRSGGFAPGGAG